MSSQRNEPERNAAGIASVNVPGLSGPTAEYESLRTSPPEAAKNKKS